MRCDEAALGTSERFGRVWDQRKGDLASLSNVCGYGRKGYLVQLIGESVEEKIR